MFKFKDLSISSYYCASKFWHKNINYCADINGGKAYKKINLNINKIWMLKIPEKEKIPNYK